MIGWMHAAWRKLFHPSAQLQQSVIAMVQVSALVPGELGEQELTDELRDYVGHWRPTARVDMVSVLRQGKLG